MPAHVKRLDPGLYEVNFGQPTDKSPLWKPASGSVRPRKVSQPNNSMIDHEHVYARVK